MGSREWGVWDHVILVTVLTATMLASDDITVRYGTKNVLSGNSVGRRLRSGGIGLTAMPCTPETSREPVLPPGASPIEPKT